MTQKQLAKSLGISNASISRIECGDLKVGLPRLYEIAKTVIKANKELNS